MTVTTSRHPIPPWMGWLIIVVAVLSTATMAVSAYRQRQCNEAIVTHQVNRFEWADEDRAALQRLVISVFEDDRDPKQFQAYQDWLRVTSRNERRRAAVSLPALADCP